jgi:catechol 2,3-dioxygenase-like lactoylglutathione lyase family enzyme
MGIRLDLVGIVVRDMRASLEFYRRLGLDIPEGAEDEPHAEATTPSGVARRLGYRRANARGRPGLDGALGRALYVPGFLVLESRRGRRDLR